MHYLCIRFKKSPQRPQADAESKRYTQLDLQGGLKSQRARTERGLPVGTQIEQNRFCSTYMTPT